jgi:hypothetical protein
MPLPTPLLTALRRAHEGDPDAAEEAFAEDATYVDETEGVQLEGLDEVVDHLSALGGRRERFLVTSVEVEGDTVVVGYDLCFQADADAFAQRGTATLRLDGDRVVAWRCRWTEVEIDRSVWG